MSFLVIVACLAAQWFLNLASTSYQKNWAPLYVPFMRKQFSKLMQGHGIFAVLILVLPLVIVASLVFTIAYHLLGHLGYLILSLALLWYCVDITELKQAPANTTSSSDLFLQGYQKIFAPLFWYFIFGPVGLVLYAVVVTLRTYLVDHAYFILTQGVLDWVPVRLVGLTFALAGNFGAVFKEWMKTLTLGVSDCQNLVAVWGDIAMSAEKKEADVISFMHRALLIWLVVMALISLGKWMG